MDGTGKAAVDQGRRRLLAAALIGTVGTRRSLRPLRRKHGRKQCAHTERVGKFEWRRTEPVGPNSKRAGGRPLFKIAHHHRRLRWPIVKDDAH
jgi:hypothetical protein